MALFRSPAPFVRSFSFPDDGQRIDGGCAVVVARGEEPGYPLANHEESDDFVWSDAQTAAFLAGEQLTLGWLSPSPTVRGKERAYICCWVTVDNY
jgi:hypothetical protein